MSCRFFCSALLSVTVLGLAKRVDAVEAKAKPNVVIIVADDLGWADVGFHSDRIPTPNIDRIAREGVELDQFYVFPMCSPTRAGLMTGRYPIRFGMARAVIPPWRHFGLDPAELTLPEALSKLGYAQRGIFGKWHLGHNDTKWHPNNQGFTHFHGHFNGARLRYRPDCRCGQPVHLPACQGRSAVFLLRAVQRAALTVSGTG